MRRAFAILLSLVIAAPALAQVRQLPTPEEDPTVPQQQQQAPLRVDQAGRVASSSVGEVGQRLDREQTAPAAEPMARLAGRIQNRVQSRIRNRIDRYYDPQANATSPFAVASEQARTAGQPPRR